MKDFYRYIFFKSYHFCIRIFKEKEFPQVWAATVVSFSILANLLSIIDVIIIVFLPPKANLYGEYHAYVALGIVVVYNIYLNVGGKYNRILVKYDRIEKSRKKVFRVLSIIYYIVTILAFVYLPHLVRIHNFGNLA